MLLSYSPGLGGHDEVKATKPKAIIKLYMLLAHASANLEFASKVSLMY